MTTLMPTPDQLHQPQRLSAVGQYLPLVADSYARATRSAARAAATPFALVCMLTDTDLHLKAGYGLELRHIKHHLPDQIVFFLPSGFVQTTNSNPLEYLNKIFSSKSGWQKHFFAFQASVPLRGADGQVLGALVVMDEQIRQLDPHAIAMLEDIAEGLVSELDLRRQLSDTPMPNTPSLAEPNPYDPAHLTTGSAVAVIAESLDGTIMYINAQAEQLLGFSSSQLVGASIAKIMPEMYIDLPLDILEQLHSGQGIAPFLSKRRQQNGQDIEVYIAQSPIFNHQKQVIGVSSSLLPKPKILPSKAKTEHDNHSQLSALVFGVSIEGQITACVGEAFPMFEEPEKMIGELIFKVFAPNPELLEAVCFALLGEEHESSIVLGTQNVRLHLHPIRSIGQPSDVLGVIIRE